MKTAMNYIITALVTILSFFNYQFIVVHIGIFYVLGNFTANLPTFLKWHSILNPIIALVLALLTGVLYNRLRMKGFKKVRIVIIILITLFFAFTIYKVLEIQSTDVMVPIYK